MMKIFLILCLLGFSLNFLSALSWYDVRNNRYGHFDANGSNKLQTTSRPSPVVQQSAVKANRSMVGRLGWIHQQQQKQAPIATRNRTLGGHHRPIQRGRVLGSGNRTTTIVRRQDSHRTSAPARRVPALRRQQVQRKNITRVNRTVPAAVHPQIPRNYLNEAHPRVANQHKVYHHGASNANRTLGHVPMNRNHLSHGNLRMVSHPRAPLHQQKFYEYIARNTHRTAAHSQNRSAGAVAQGNRLIYRNRVAARRQRPMFTHSNRTTSRVIGLTAKSAGNIAHRNQQQRWQPFHRYQEYHQVMNRSHSNSQSFIPRRQR